MKTCPIHHAKDTQIRPTAYSHGRGCWILSRNQLDQFLIVEVPECFWSTQLRIESHPLIPSVICNNERLIILNRDAVFDKQYKASHFWFG